MKLQHSLLSLSFFFFSPTLSFPSPFDVQSLTSPLASRNVDSSFNRFSSPYPFYPENILSGGRGCRSKPIEAGFHNITLKTLDTAANSTGEMIERTHTLYIPEVYDGTQPLPTLMAFHGSGSSPYGLIHDNELKSMADDNGFILIAPTGGTTFTPTGNGWTVPYVPAISSNVLPNEQQDIDYILQVLRHSQATLCTDHSRSYAAGHSGGARMSSALACDPVASYHFAAIAPVSGLRAGPPNDDNGSGPVTEGYKACRPSRPLGIVTVHSGQDTTNPYFGNDNPQWSYGIPEAISQWRAILGCSTARKLEREVNNTEPLVVRNSVDWCGRGAITEYFIERHEHNWPVDVANFPVNNLIWDLLTRWTL